MNTFPGIPLSRSLSAGTRFVISHTLSIGYDSDFLTSVFSRDIFISLDILVDTEVLVVPVSVGTLSLSSVELLRLYFGTSIVCIGFDDKAVLLYNISLL
jgi:hypothetical protein